MVPKKSGFNQSETACGIRAHSVTFSMLPAMARDDKIIKSQTPFNGDTICHPRSAYVTTKMHGTSIADETIM